MPSSYCLVRHKLPVLWIMPLSGDSGKGNITAEVLPAVELALHHLSEQPAPLGNYELQFHLTDSEVNTTDVLVFLILLVKLTNPPHSSTTMDINVMGQFSCLMK